VLIRVPGKAPATPGVYTAKGAFKGPYCDDVGQCYMPKEYPWQAQVTVKAAAEAPAPTAAPAPATPAATAENRNPEGTSILWAGAADALMPRI
jgi:hypothetical protein